MSISLKIWDERITLQFVKQQYLNGNLAIDVLSKDEEYGGWESWCYLTVNLPFYLLNDNQAFLDIGNCSKEVIDWLYNNKYVKEIGREQSGFCTYPLVEFNREFMEKILIKAEDLLQNEEA